MLTAPSDLPEKPESEDEIVRTLEDSGYPVDGAEEPVIDPAGDPFPVEEETSTEGCSKGQKTQPAASKEKPPLNVPRHLP